MEHAFKERAQIGAGGLVAAVFQIAGIKRPSIPP